MIHNILITSAGQRVALVRGFQETLKRFFPEAKVFTTDMNPKLAPAAYVSDGCFEVLRVTDPNYIPQLINVLKGDMALIGPRPLLVQYLPLYSLEQARRHEVRPGISGWAQCHGRNAISWTEKFKLDVWYVDHVSLFTDLKVIFITIKKVLFKEDINQVGGEWATMDPFNGHN